VSSEIKKRRQPTEEFKAGRPGTKKPKCKESKLK
jgi:hypothetical protein